MIGLDGADTMADVAGVAVTEEHGGACVLGRDEPAGESDAVVGGERDRFEGQADVVRGGRDVPVREEDETVLENEHDDNDSQIDTGQDSEETEADSSDSVGFGVHKFSFGSDTKYERHSA